MTRDPPYGFNVSCLHTACHDCLHACVFSVAFWETDGFLGSNQAKTRTRVMPVFLGT